MEEERVSLVVSGWREGSRSLKLDAGAAVPLEEDGLGRSASLLSDISFTFDILVSLAVASQV
jgi:hypothetical protein